jgi:hypothetical protein
MTTSEDSQAANPATEETPTPETPERWTAASGYQVLMGIAQICFGIAIATFSGGAMASAAGGGRSLSSTPAPLIGQIPAGFLLLTGIVLALAGVVRVARK